VALKLFEDARHVTELPTAQDFENDDDFDQTSFDNMRLSTLVMETDFLVKCAAHLVLVSRKAGGQAGLGLPLELTAGDNLFAAMRDEAMTKSVAAEKKENEPPAPSIFAPTKPPAAA